jgi:hypothetical protein
VVHNCTQKNYYHDCLKYNFTLLQKNFLTEFLFSVKKKEQINVAAKTKKQKKRQTASFSSVNIGKKESATATQTLSAANHLVDRGE